MKKKILAAVMTGALVLGSSLIKQNNAKAEDVLGIGTTLEAIHDLFCPETPQKRCKPTGCLDGACISFRKACSTNDDCK
ncbi:MAG: hypothetical protein K2Y12_10270 [Chitinophagaceae bacterium]|nr:hypothetical protein [Chitinophagaceae bacterium]